MADRRRSDVLGMGALNVDELLRVPRNVGGDSEMVAFDHTVDAGGSAANTVFGLAKLGMSCGFLGAVGSDDGGTMLRSSLEDQGVDTSLVATKAGSSSGVAHCIVDQRSQRQITLWPGANDLLSMSDADPLLRGRVTTRLLHLTSFVGGEQLQIQIDVARALARSSLISFSPGALYVRRGMEEIVDLLEACNLLFVNAAELSALMGTDPLDYLTAARNFLNKFDRCDSVIVTLGSGTSRRKGGRIRPEQRTIEEALGEGPPPLEGERTSCAVVQSDRALMLRYADFTPATDSTGAGDAFASGYLFGVLRGMGLEQSTVLGHLSAQFCVAGLGARRSLPTANQLLEALGKANVRLVDL